MTQPASTRLRRRRKRTTPLGTPAWKRALATAGSACLAAGEQALQGIKRHPRALAGIVGAGLLALLLNGAANRFESWHQQRLPDVIDVRSTDSELKESFVNVAHKRLEEARGKKRDRAWLLERLRSDLANQPRVAQFWARTSLSGRLEIQILPEIPFAVLEAANAERMLVSREGKVLTKNQAQIPAQTGASNGLLVVEIPELKLIASEAGRAPSPNLNLPWILRRAEEISRGLLANSASPFRLARIQWRTQNGFLLTGNVEVKAADGSALAQPLTVQFTDAEAGPQLERLQRVLTHLRARNLAPTNIDLNFKDKALIQLSGAASPMEM